MSKLYQSTTESLESLDAGGPTCAPPLPCKRRKAMDSEERLRRKRPEDLELGEFSGRSYSRDAEAKRKNPG